MSTKTSKFAREFLIACTSADITPFLSDDCVVVGKNMQTGRSDALPYLREVLSGCLIYEVSSCEENGSAAATCRVLTCGGIGLSVTLICRVSGDNYLISAVTLTEVCESRNQLGEIVYSSTDDYTVLRINDEAVGIYGYDDKKRLMERLRRSSNNTAYGCDVPQFRETLQRAASCDEKINFEFRIIKQSGELAFVCGNMQRLTLDGESAVFSVFLDITSHKKNEEQLAEENRSTIRRLSEENTRLSTECTYYRREFNSLPCGVVNATIEEEPVIIGANDGAIMKMGYFPKNFFDRTHYLYEFLDPETKKRIKAVKAQLLNNNSAAMRVMEYEMTANDGSRFWVRDMTRIIYGKDGKPSMQCILNDISREKEREEQGRRQENEIKLYAELVQRLYDTIPCGIIRYRSGETNSITYINRLGAVVLGYPDEKSFYKCARELEQMGQRDNIMFELVPSYTGLGEKECFEKQFVKNDGTTRWLHITTQSMLDIKGDRIIQSVFFDNTERHIIDEKIRMSEQRFRIAIEEASIFIWEYDIKSRRCKQSKSYTEKFRSDEIVDDYPEAILGDDSIIHPDSRLEYRKLHDRIRAGAQRAVGEFLIRTRRGKYEWQRVTYRTIFADDGTPVTAIGISEDLTEQKLAEQRYADENAYRSALEEGNLLLSLRVNVTSDIIEDNSQNYPFADSSEQTASFMNAVMQAAREIPDVNERREMIRIFARDNLLSSFRSGQSTVEYVYKRIIDKSTKWVSTVVRLLQKPGSSDVAAFVYTRDVNAEKLTSGILTSVADEDYDFIGYYDVPNDRFTMYHIAERYGNQVEPVIEHYGEYLKYYIGKKAEPDEVSDVLEKMSAERILGELDSGKKCYTVYRTDKEKDGTHSHKLLKYYYLDKANKILINTRTDITALFIREQERSSLLSSALAAVQKANGERSDYLSQKK